MDNIVFSKLMDKDEKILFTNLDLEYSITVGNAGNILVFR